MNHLNPDMHMKTKTLQILLTLGVATSTMVAVRRLALRAGRVLLPILQHSLARLVNACYRPFGAALGTDHAPCTARYSHVPQAIDQPLFIIARDLWWSGIHAAGLLAALSGAGGLALSRLH
jgi:hypothetical protein